MAGKSAKSVPKTKKRPRMTPAKYRRYWTTKVDPRSGLCFVDPPSLPNWLQIQKIKQTKLVKAASLHRCSLCLASGGSSDGRRFLTAESRLEHLRLHLSLESLREPDEAELEALVKEAFPNVPRSQPTGGEDANEPHTGHTLGDQCLPRKRKKRSTCACPNCLVGEARPMVKREGQDQRNNPFDGCEQRFTGSSDLTKHRRRHSGEKPFHCEFEGCGMRFSVSGGLMKHRRVIHNGEKPFRCDFDGCGKLFTSYSNRTVHQRTHSGEKPFVCDTCGKCFSHRNSLSAHCHMHAAATVKPGTGHRLATHDYSSPSH